MSNEKYYKCLNCGWLGTDPDTCGNGEILICPDCWAEAIEAESPELMAVK
ncbi:hypothetical protein ES705_21967 [subsurface metagenome]